MKGRMGHYQIRQFVREDGAYEKDFLTCTERSGMV